MISVKNLTKRFGETVAVNNVTFEIPKGQLVGFLGPNGAGKTTTMRLLTGYLAPDDGEATLLGKNLSTESLEIRSKLGYLPENNPLPDDIEVTEYLHFIGRLRGLKNDSDRLSRVKTVLKLCSLGSVIGKKLGELSKGFRQRVGLAQSIIHDPDILILDEPTSGLDPNQVQDVRGLIQNLKAEKTLLLSTHILTEVQSTCDRIIIINNGQIAADGSPDRIGGHIQNVNRLMVSLRAGKEDVEASLKGLPGALKVELQQAHSSGEDLFMIESESSVDLREAVFKEAVEKKWPILEMKQERLNLEEIFRTLTTQAPLSGNGGGH